MTLPLFLLADGALREVSPGARLVLDGDEGRHAATVRRIRAGESVDVADGSGRTARCEVVEALKAALVLRVEALADVAPRLPGLVLVQALAKGGRDEAAVETATEYGVDAVVPWQAGRSVVRWAAERGEKSRLRWGATARAAAKQSRRATVPDVGPLVTTTALARRTAEVVATGGAVLVLHEGATEPLATAPLPDAGRPGAEVLVVVGPEGGIAPDEVEALVTAGARAVVLGPEVLRASSAGPAALAVLSVRLRRWG
ncbi:16S rRNA (uracil(1498)-N(3))-methyltransferase [Kineosporia sp. A_224]|uniref:16S rRNA (uracil(1498)-N(3))-methyltransferase n=1 Tax=Kineosporia sp. A_224 TaxID=1962180 RepID=UPI000B4B87FF|nr:16S rRNA (uracil(1498)-N(3))-methyltransferase [Kineosporia sp. A_224]